MYNNMRVKRTHVGIRSTLLLTLKRCGRCMSQQAHTHICMNYETRDDGNHHRIYVGSPNLYLEFCICNQTKDLNQ